MTKTFQGKTLFGYLNFGHWDLPFDLAQGGEPSDPFDIWSLIFGISTRQRNYSKANPLWGDVKAGPSGPGFFTLLLKTWSRDGSEIIGLAVNLCRGILEYWNVGFSGLRSDLTMTYPQ